MKRATITLPDELNKRLNAYLEAQPVQPSLTKVMQAALEKFLDEQVQTELAKRGYRPPTGFPDFPIFEKGSGKSDISFNHDKYFAEAFKE